MFRLKNNLNKATLFNGDETAFRELFSKPLFTSDGKYSFNLSQAVPLSTENTTTYFNSTFLEELLLTKGFKKGRSVFGHHVNSSNLKVHVVPVNNALQATNLLLIIAFGETNPGHFVLEQEALLENEM